MNLIPVDATMRSLPWYRERWPWILMSGPAIVIVAGLFTGWLAFTSEDGLVVDDYYKQGLAINQVLGRGDAAERRGISAHLTQSDGRVRVVLRDRAETVAQTLRLVHPTRAGMDRNVTLRMTQPGIYEGALPVPSPGRWHVALEAREWRLAGEWSLPAAGALALGAHRSPHSSQ